MVNDILFASGITFKETRFIQPPRTTYAVFNDTYRRYGADTKNLLCEHDITIELYEYSPDSSSEYALETQLDNNKLEYTKHERYWIESEQLYQVIYEFSYITKGD